MRYMTIISSLLSLLLTSCSEVYFEQPQPPGKTNISAFPHKIHGLYLTPEGDSMLSIYNNHIMYYMDQEKGLRFTMNDNLIARKYRGDYYININDTENPYWMVFLFTFKKGNLLLKYPDLQDGDLEKFRKIATIREANEFHEPLFSGYLLNPSLKELRQLVKEDFFMATDTLVKAIK